MSFLRARQRTQTALFPHQANRTHLIPKRPPGPQVLSTIFKTVQADVSFDVPISGGDIAKFTLTANGVDVALIAAVNGGLNDILVSHALLVVGDFCILTYEPGTWSNPVRGAVRGFTQVGNVI